MLAVARATTSTLNGREVIVAIIGGTMLTLALTRPRLRWVERLTEDAPRARLGADRALTCLSLVMAGYALLTLNAALHKQLDAGSDGLLRGAILFLIGYGLLVHFEPFSREWRLRGGVAAWVLYISLALALGMFGGVLAEWADHSSISAVPVTYLLVIIAVVALGWTFYRLLPAFDKVLDELVTLLARRLGIDSPPERDGPEN